VERKSLNKRNVFFEEFLPVKVAILEDSCLVGEECLFSDWQGFKDFSEFHNFLVNGANSQGKYSYTVTTTS